jgi:hypothetical protein
MRWSWLAELLPGALDALAEGSLLWVGYVALASLGSGRARLGPLEFVLVAALGVVASRWAGVQHARRFLLPTLALAAAVVGWIADPVVRETLVGPDPAAALARHLPGWLLGLALLRGAAHTDPADDDRVTSALLAVGVPALAIPWLLPAVNHRPDLAAPVLLGSLVFVASGLLAIAFGRLQALGLAPHESRGGRAWTMVAITITALMGGLAIGAALLLGAPIQLLVAAALGPAARFLALLLAWLAPLLAPIWTALAPIVGSIRLPGVGPATSGGTPPGPVPVGPVPPASAPPPFVPFLVALAALLALALLIRYRRVFNSPRPWKPERGAEERVFVPPHMALDLRLPWRRPRLRLPHRPAALDAPGAYLQVLAELARHPDLRRDVAETPAAHARRIRGRGLSDAAFGLLAADFELVRYGDRTLSDRETRRGISRAQRLRREIRARRAAEVEE